MSKQVAVILQIRELDRARNVINRTLLVSLNVIQYYFKLQCKILTIALRVLSFISLYFKPSKNYKVIKIKARTKAYDSNKTKV